MSTFICPKHGMISFYSNKKKIKKCKDIMNNECDLFLERLNKDFNYFTDQKQQMLCKGDLDAQ